MNPTNKIRAGHASITMESPHQGEGGEEGAEQHPSLMVFGGGDNNGDFYNDIVSIELWGLDTFWYYV